MYAPGYITREEEAKIPSFISHDEARKWFKEKYGDNFMMTSSELIDGQKCYFYNLILDRNVFEVGQRELKKEGFMKDALTFLGSYQSIQIFEDGSIHIVH